MIFSFLTVLEIALFCLAVYSIIRKHKHSISLSFSYAAVFTMIIPSLGLQAVFMLGMPGLYWLMDAAIIIFSLREIYNNRKNLLHDATALGGFLKQSPLSLYLMVPVLIYLFLQAFFVPPGNADSMVYNIARVFMFKTEGSMFVENYSYFSQVAYPVGFDLLSYFFIRFNSDFGLGIFSFISYLIIISATFSLVRAFYDGGTAVAVTIITASMTEIVLQATSSKNDIPTAALVCVIFLAGHHFFISRKPLHLYMMIVSLLWGLTVKGYFPGFLLPFVLFYSIWFLRRSDETFSFKKIIKSVRINRYIIIPAGLIVCLAVLYGANFHRFGHILGEKKKVTQHQNRGGITGALLNLGRYMVQSTEIPIKYGYKLNEIHQGLPDRYKLKGLRDTNIPVDLAAKPFVSEDFSWYGPLSVFFIIPAMLFSLVMARDYSQTVSLTLLSFFVIICYKVAWMPWNTRLFSLFFAGSGLCTAYLFNRLFNYFSNRQNGKPEGAGLIKRYIRATILIIAVYGLLSAVLLNDLKPTVPRYQSTNLLYNLYRSGTGMFSGTVNKKKRWFTWLRKVSARHRQYDRFFPKNMLKTFVSSLEKDKKVLVLGYYMPVFPLFILRPDLDITVSRPGTVSIDNTVFELGDKSGYDTVKNHYDYIVLLTTDIKKTAVYKYIKGEEQLFQSQKAAIFRLSH